MGASGSRAKVKFTCLSQSCHPGVTQPLHSVGVNLTTSHTRLYIRTLALCAAIAGLVPVHAQTTPAATTGKTEKETGIVRLEEFEVSEARTSAESMAPTTNRLEAIQPESIINLQTIQNSIVPTADYALIANLAPSVTLTGVGNGPGLTESKATMRGFGDGSYNVTVDGIPFGDGNDYTHHTTSYFPAKLLGRVTVDRGPGTASTIGMATFGGTMALETKDPRTTASIGSGLSRLTTSPRPRTWSRSRAATTLSGAIPVN